MARATLVILLAMLGLAGGPVGAEPIEPAPTAGAPDAEALLSRLWQVTALAPTRPVLMRVVGGLGPNAVSAPGGITLSREFLRRTRRLRDGERILARTLAHELAHIALGHTHAASPRAELDAEALGIRYFELAGLDCRWWVAYVASAAETAGRHGWPPLREVIAHDRQACARARADLGRAADPAPARTDGIVNR
ncbi:MAG: hypothetical protein ACREMB_28175 [Candidatus Rokuibacteriota bacterium]